MSRLMRTDMLARADISCGFVNKEYAYSKKITANHSDCAHHSDPDRSRACWNWNTEYQPGPAAWNDERGIRTAGND